MTATAVVPLADAAVPRTDVFISYSRRDSDFVRRLHAALAAGGKDAWVDWEDIPASAPWRDRISAGIDAAPSFVFVLSPESLASGECGNELEHARARNKRIVAIVARPVDPEAAPPELTELNWILFDADFDSGVEKLIQALDTDLEWLETHARLLVRAVEWEREQRDDSFLLRGSELESAERWLARQSGHAEAATPLQTEYVLTSRRASTRRQRALLAGVATALVLSLGLAALAAALWRQSVANEREATSRELAATASFALGSDPELALLVAREAAAAAPTEEAASALRQALAESQVRFRLRHGAEVRNARFSPDGKRIVTASEDGTARVWDAETGAPLAVLRHEGKVFDVAVHPDGDHVGTAFYDRDDSGGTAIWRMGGQHVASALGRGAGAEVEFAPSGRWLATRDFLGNAGAWTVEGGELEGGELSLPAETGSTEGGSIDSWAFDVKGSLVATTVDRYDPDDEDIFSNKFVQIRIPSLGHRISTTLDGHDDIGRSAEFSPDSQRIVTAGYGPTARVWDVKTGKPRAILRGHDDAVITAEFSADGAHVITGAHDATARVWDTTTWRTVVTLRGHTAPVVAASFSPDGRRVITSSDDGTARVWQIPARIKRSRSQLWQESDFSPDRARAVVGTSRGVELWRLRPPRRIASLTTAPPYHVAFNADGSRIVTVDEENGGTIWRGDDGKSVAAIPPELGNEDPVLSSDGKFLVVGTDSGALVQSLDDGRIVPTIRAAPGAAGLGVVGAGPAARKIVTWEFGEGHLLDASTGRRTATLKLDDTISEIVIASFTRDGRRLLTVDDHHLVALWDASSGDRLASLRGHSSMITSARWNEDGTKVLTASYDRTAVLWDAATGQTLGVFRPHTESVTSADFSAGEEFVTTTSGDNAVRIWDADTGRPITTMMPGPGSIFRALLLPGTSLAILVPGRPPMVASCDLCVSLEQLVRRAEEQSTRSLTPLERARYLHE